MTGARLTAVSRRTPPSHATSQR